MRCLRAFESTPNPNNLQRLTRPYLQRRAPRSLECATCPKVIRISYIDEDPEQLQVRLRNEPTVYNEFMHGVTDMEHRVNTGQPIPHPRRRRQNASTDGQQGEDEDGDETDEASNVDAKHNKIIEASLVANLKFEEIVGRVLAAKGV